MFKRLIKKLYFKAYPDKAEIDRDELRALEYENRDLNAEVRRLRDELNPYFQSNYTRIPLKPVCYEAIEFVPVDMIPTDTAEKTFEKYLRDNFARKLEPEIAKRFIIKQDKALSNPISTAYRAYIKFYEEA